MTWIVLAIVLVALVVLVAAARSVLVRLPGLRRAVLTLQRRLEQAESLQRGALLLQERIADLQRQAEAAQRSVTLIKARRDG